MTAKSVLQGAWTQPLRAYVDRQQMTVAEWVDLQPIFDISARETGYEGGGILWVTWCGQKAEGNQLRVSLEKIWKG